MVGNLVLMLIVWKSGNGITLNRKTFLKYLLKLNFHYHLALSFSGFFCCLSKEIFFELKLTLCR